jgi:hypothetical protein
MKEIVVPGGTIHYRKGHGWYGCAPPVGLYGPFSTQEGATAWVEEKRKERAACGTN